MGWVVIYDGVALFSFSPRLLGVSDIRIPKKSAGAISKKVFLRCIS